MSKRIRAISRLEIIAQIQTLEDLAHRHLATRRSLFAKIEAAQSDYMRQKWRLEQEGNDKALEELNEDLNLWKAKLHAKS